MERKGRKRKDEREKDGHEGKIDERGKMIRWDTKRRKKEAKGKMKSEKRGKWDEKKGRRKSNESRK